MVEDNEISELKDRVAELEKQMRTTATILDKIVNILAKGDK